MLGDVPPILRWEVPSKSESLARTEDEYLCVLAGALGAALARFERTDPLLAANVLALAADADSLRAVLLAPSTSSRLLWPDRHDNDPHALGAFIADALTLERARRSGTAPHVAELNRTGRQWTALADYCFDTTRGAWIQQRPVNGLSVDVASPNVTALDADLRIGGGVYRYDDPTQEARALIKVESALSALDAVGRGIAAFVRRFTLVAHLVTDSALGRFSSGSTNQYVGRSIFWNVHLPSVDVGTVAEALVHEAVHSLLYMNEAGSPWVVGPTGQPPEHDRICSPWSGAFLPVEPFLQACFVWYALLNFWDAARSSSAFPAERVRRGIRTARSGFLNGSLTSMVRAGEERIATDVLGLIRAIQADVTTRVRLADRRTPA